jgi:ribosomal protein S12 methylthiotransferase accessory factor
VHLARVCAPQVTLAHVRGILPRVGITRVADVTGLDEIGVPVVMVVRPNARSLSVAQGKGLDLVSAQVSGIMESVECFHAERIGSSVRVARYDDIVSTSEIVQLERLPRIAGRIFRPQTPIPWIEAFDLASRNTKLVPLEMVSADFSIPGMPGGGFFPMSTNGLASGNTISEAIVHGLCEVMERDAFALWRASNGATAVRVNLAAEPDPLVVALVERIANASCALVVDEITTDVGVPVFLATLSGGGHGSAATESPAGGLGCHPDRVLAMLRSITEAAQSRLTRISGARDDLEPHWFRPIRAPAQPTRPNPPRRGLRGCAGVRHDVVEDDLAWIEEQLNRAGFMERLVVDLTRQDIMIPVVRVIVPGLEPPHELGCVPGRRAVQFHASGSIPCNMTT